MTVEQELPAANFVILSQWFAQRSVAENAPHLSPHIKHDSRIVDVEFGIGSITLDLASGAPDGFVLGIDYSAESINVAKAEAERRSITNVKFMVGNAEDLTDLDPNTFDIAHLHQVLLHLLHPVKVLQEIRRILKPSGVIATRDNFRLYAIPSYPTIDKNWEIYRHISKKHGAEPDGGMINHIWMHEAGFSWDKIEIGSSTFEYSRQEQRKFWTDSQRGGISTLYETPAEKDFLEALNKELDDFVANPAARVIGVDGWVIGRK